MAELFDDLCINVNYAHVSETENVNAYKETRELYKCFVVYNETDSSRNCRLCKAVKPYRNYGSY
jgi:hypothetical protein